MQWDRPDVWDALARRDIGAVYRLLSAEGLTQAEIAARTGQAQSEVSAIMAGRQVMSYAVLERIAAAFDIPRGHLGLGYGPDEDQPRHTSEQDERDRVLAHAAKISLGWPAFGEPDHPTRRPGAALRRRGRLARIAGAGSDEPAAAADRD